MKVYSIFLFLTFFVAAQEVLAFKCSNKYGSQKHPGRSCTDILTRRCETPTNGIYWIGLNSFALKSFPVFCDMNAGGWTLIFKVVAGVPGIMSEYWKLTYPMYEYSVEALNTRNDFRHHYKNRIVQNWSTFKPKQARVVLYNQTMEQVVLRFDARNSDNLNWFSMKNLQESPWRDISTKTKNYFSLKGDCRNGHCRDFIVNHAYGGCPGDIGWLVTGTIRACKWETRFPEVSFFFSKKDTAVNYNKFDQVGTAEVFAVYVR